MISYIKLSPSRMLRGFGTKIVSFLKPCKLFEIKEEKVQVLDPLYHRNHTFNSRDHDDYFILKAVFHIAI